MSPHLFLFLFNCPKTPFSFIERLMEGGEEGAGRNKHPADRLHESISLWDVAVMNTRQRLACERKANQSHIAEQRLFQNMLRQWDKRDLPLPRKTLFHPATKQRPCQSLLPLHSKLFALARRLAVYCTWWSRMPPPPCSQSSEDTILLTLKTHSRFLLFYIKT